MSVPYLSHKHQFNLSKDRYFAFNLHIYADSAEPAELLSAKGAKAEKREQKYIPARRKIEQDSSVSD